MVPTQKLIATARAIQGEFDMGGDRSAGSVAAALEAADGRIYTGICLDLRCGIGFCAEHAAVAEMLKRRQTRILAVAAVNRDGVLPPCGRCRELMLQVDERNAEALVALTPARSTPLRELLPAHWIQAKLLLRKPNPPATGA